jgi:hypothetical protein
MKHALPARIVDTPDGPRVEWIEGDGERFAEPFFEETLRRAKRGGGAVTTTGLEALDGDAAPDALVFHVSRCGSTLASQMLAAVPEHLAVSEAPVIDDILRLDVDQARRIALLRGAMAAFARSQAQAPGKLFVKLDCWHLFQLPLMRRAFPDTPMLLVWRDPLEVLVSLMRMPSQTLIRGVVTPGQLGISEAARDALIREENAAAILGAFFREAAARRAWLTSVAYPDLPGALPGALPFDAETTAVMLAAAGRDSKSPGQAFTPDAARKRAEATPAMLAALERWTTPHFERWTKLVSVRP